MKTPPRRLMGAILLDSTVLIDVLKGRTGASTRFLALQPAGDIPHVCAVTVEEVSSFLLLREREEAGAMFEGLSVAPLGIAEGRLAGSWRRSYRSQGRAISQAAALIAARSGRDRGPCGDGQSQGLRDARARRRALAGRRVKAEQGRTGRDVRESPRPSRRKRG